VVWVGVFLMVVGCVWVVACGLGRGQMREGFSHLASGCSPRRVGGLGGLWVSSNEAAENRLSWGRQELFSKNFFGGQWGHFGGGQWGQALKEPKTKEAKSRAKTRRFRQ
jgi:hypothetical protein